MSPEVMSVEKGKEHVELDICSNFPEMARLKQVYVNSDLVVATGLVAGTAGTLRIDASKFVNSLDPVLPLKLTVVDESMRIHEFQLLLRRSDRVEIRPTELRERRRADNTFSARAYLTGPEVLINRLAADNGLSCKVDCEGVGNLSATITSVRRFWGKTLTVDVVVDHELSEPKCVAARWIDVDGEEVAKTSLRLIRKRSAGG
ncbi:hypothetical protein GCM10023156_58320 [Novipirellula rosea]|uniref:YbbR-like protein n=1 Tax=Novipirellula rosea TaxID=1031540 RepID=A0ABP8NJ00_9BACT